MKIALIGYRGTGKSTVARHLALELACNWADADVDIELKAGKSIAAIFADDGESRFRDLEQEVLAELVARDNIIIAAGGGVVLREANRRQLAHCDCVVWLNAAPATILARLADDATTAGRRPNLTTAGGEAEVVRLLAERLPLYTRCADLAIDTDDKTPGEIARLIISQVHLSKEAS